MTHEQDRLLYRIIISTLSLGLLIIICGDIYIYSAGKSIPSELTNLGTNIVVGLAALLVQSPLHKNES